MASIYDKASLVLIPSGTKTSKVYSQKPTNGDGDFTFSRSTAATRVNASGNIEKETQNLFWHSNTFNTTWGTIGLNAVSGQAGYDGTNDAWKLDVTATGNYRRVYQGVTNTGVLTFSCYAKAGTTDYLLIYNNNFSPTGYFDLTNGVVASTGGNILASNIESVGGGWYRCSLTYNLSATSQFWICPSNGNGDVTADAGDYIYIQDAQLEQGLVARDYIETTTTAIYGGITDNVPRLDYTDSSCPALLLEPQRTNLAEYSEYFETYSKTRVDFVHNATTSPEGVVNAVEFNDTATSGTHFIQLRSGVVGGGVMSFFAKQNTHRYVQAGPSSSIGKRVFFDLQDGVMATIGGSAESYYGIEDYGNGWYRCYVAFGDLENPSIFTAAGDGSSSAHNNYTGDGSGVYIYGAQIEQDTTYHTSYIPTYGSAVTRNIPTLQNLSLGDYIGQTQGTIFVDVEYLDGTGDDVFRINNNVDGIGISKNQNSMVMRTYQSGVRTDTTGSTTADSIKVAYVYTSSGIKMFINGSLNTSRDFSVSFGSTLDELILYGSPYYIGRSLKRLNQVLVFPTALTDQEAIDLTTI